jgi:hypothetical protein
VCGLLLLERKVGSQSTSNKNVDKLAEATSPLKSDSPIHFGEKGVIFTTANVLTRFKGCAPLTNEN